MKKPKIQTKKKPTETARERGLRQAMEGYRQQVNMVAQDRGKLEEEVESLRRENVKMRHSLQARDQLIHNREDRQSTMRDRQAGFFLADKRRAAAAIVASMAQGPDQISEASLRGICRDAQQAVDWIWDLVRS